MKISTKSIMAIAAAALMASGSAQAEEIKFKTDGGLKWETADGSASGQFGGRVMADANYYDEDVNNGHESGLEFRRLRLFGKGVYLDYEGKVQVDFSSKSNEIAIKDAYISKKAFGGKVIGGHFKQPFGLEELTSSKYITFMERTMNGISTSHKMGLGYTRNTEHSTFTVAGYDPNDYDDKGADGAGIGARFTYAPHVDKGNVTHFGFAAASENGMSSYSKSVRPGHLGAKTSIVSVAGNKDVDVGKIGLEAALARGPFSLQGEFMSANVDSSTANADETVNAFYVSTSFFLTRDTRPYKAKSGAFDRSPSTVCLHLPS